MIRNEFTNLYCARRAAITEVKVNLHQYLPFRAEDGDTSFTV